MGTGCCRTGWASTILAAANQRAAHSWPGKRFQKRPPRSWFEERFHRWKRSSSATLPMMHCRRGVFPSHSEVPRLRILLQPLFAAFKATFKSNRLTSGTNCRFLKVDAIVGSSANADVRRQPPSHPPAARQTHTRLPRSAMGGLLAESHGSGTTRPERALLRGHDRAIKRRKSINSLLHPRKHQDDLAGSCLLFIFTAALVTRYRLKDIQRQQSGSDPARAAAETQQSCYSTGTLIWNNNNNNIII